ncbi:octopamine receptor-like [Patiria miniata]|uniref:G-protein coupled receptors family 1 profile domain-containing protein n=1 Tax=Patiria miniata TaxID=46514 RepID=A0A914A2V2_PATMI|nr:octopamine receptor-like [Patiria miniata]
MMRPNESYFSVESEGGLQYFDSNWTILGSVLSPEDDDDTSWGFSPEREVDHQVRWPIGVMLTALTVLIALGNSLVVLALLLERQLRTFENFFFASLAIADLSIALFVLPLTLNVELSDGKWHFGRAACDFFIFVDVSCCTASILHLCTIGLNRYWSISSHLRNGTKQTNKRAFLTILSVWFLSFVIASPPIFGWPKRTNNITDQCTYDQDRLYVICSALGSFYIPLVVMLTVYCKIYRLSKKGAQFRRSLPRKNGAPARVRHTGTHRSASDPSHDTDSNHRFHGSTITARHPDGAASNAQLVHSSKVKALSQQRARTRRKVWCLVRRAASKRKQKKSGMHLAEVKTAKTLGLIMTVFVVCWLPFFLLYVIKPFCPSCYIPVALDRAALWLGYANSLLNPIIYICCKPLFRRAFKKILLLNYCKHVRRYTLHIECCPPARHRLHHVERQRRHVTDGETSLAYRAGGRLGVSVPPEILHIDDRFHRGRPSFVRRSSEQASWTSSARGGTARGTSGRSGSSSSHASIDWSSFDRSVMRVPNVCVTDIPEALVSSEHDHKPHQTTAGSKQRQATDQRVYGHANSTPVTDSNIARTSGAQHRQSPQTDRILNSDISPRVRILNRRSSWSSPANWRRQESSSTN